MRSASVGFHCPECVATSSQVVYSGRNIQAQTAPLQFIIPAILVACYAVQVVVSRSLTSGQAVQNFAMQRDYVADGEWWRLVTAGFLHNGPIHLAFNAYFFYVLMGPLQRMAGTLGAVGVVLMGIVGGDIGVELLGREFAVGASGGAYAVMGAMLVYSLVHQQSLKGSPILTLLGLNLLLTFIVPGLSIGGHLGGLAAGAASGAILFAAPKSNLSMTMRGAIVVCSTVLLVGVGAFLANTLIGYNT
jgi:membrane associated rhomboid family serine protease